MKFTSKTKSTITSIVICSLASITSVSAQETKLEADLSADIVSAYVWRGTRAAGLSIQPTLSVSYGDLSLGAWGSTDAVTNSEDSYKEVDFSLSYSKHAFTALVTDYWWDGNNSFNYFGGKGHASHSLEGTIAYTLPESFPLSIAWNTFFVGQYDKDESGDQTYSTYIELTYPFKVSNIDMGIAIGCTPWKSAVYGTDGFKFTNVTLGASKKIKLSESFSLPIFANIIANPYTEDMNFVFGIRLQQ